MIVSFDRRSRCVSKLGIHVASDNECLDEDESKDTVTVVWGLHAGVHLLVMARKFSIERRTFLDKSQDD